MPTDYTIKKFSIKQQMKRQIKPLPPSVDPRRVSKHFDIVLGFDFHIIKVGMIPVPCPVTPFGALIFDVMDYLHITIPAFPQIQPKNEDGSGMQFAFAPMQMGGTVQVNGFYKGSATSGLLSLPPTVPPLPKFAKAAKKLNMLHLVLPKPLFVLPPLAPHDGEVSHGSQKVLVEGMEMTGQFNNAYSCADFGSVLLTNPTGFFNYYLTSVAVCLPVGSPVYVGGPFVQHQLTGLEIANALLMMGVMKGLSLAKKLLGKLLTKLNKLIASKNPKLFKLCQNIQPFICKYLGEPVDVATGRLYGAIQGFELKGPLPFVWKAKYFSDTQYRGELGMGVLHSYSHTLMVSEQEGVVGFIDANGITMAFPTLAPGEEFFHPTYKWTLHREAQSLAYYLTNKKGERYDFTRWQDADGWQHLEGITDRNGFAVRFSFDYDRRLASATDSAGRKIRFSNDKEGRITKIEIPDAAGESYQTAVSYEYDKDGRMVSFTDRTGVNQTLEWDEADRLVSRSFKRGDRFTFRYDKKGRCTAAEGPDGVFSYYFEYRKGVTVVTDSLGVKKRYYHSNGIVTKERDSRGGETLYQYDQHQNLLIREAPDGKSCLYNYDDRGNLVSAQIPGNGVVKIEYDRQDLPISIQSPSGACWKYEYDALGNLIKQTDADGRESTCLRSDGVLKEIQDSISGTTALKYDSQYLLSEIIHPDRAKEEWNRDRHGNILTYTNVKGAETRYIYDAADRVVEAHYPDGNVRSFKYGKTGLASEIVDKDSGMGLYYDLFGNITYRTQAGSMLSFGYDKEGRLVKVTNEQHEQYIFQRDGEGDIIEEIGFDGIRRTYERDYTGLVQSMCMNHDNRLITTYQYDDGNRISEIIRPDGAIEEYEYNVSGLLTKAINGDATVEFTYDKLGRVLKESCNGNEVINSYNQLGLRSGITSSLGADIHYGYDHQGDLSYIASGEWQSNYKRDVMGLETEVTMPGNLLKETVRDAMGRVTEQKVEKGRSVVDEKSYLWGTSDRLLSVMINGGQRRYEYNSRGFLVKTFFEDGSVQYRVPDSAGNLFESPDLRGRTYGPGGRLEKQGDWKFQYDELGNLIKKSKFWGETWKYEWDSAGMLSKVIKPDGKEISFKYDALGRRISKDCGSYTVKWVWDGNVPLHECKEVFDWDYTKEKGTYLKATQKPVITWVFEQGTFVPVAKLSGNESYSIVTNYMGTPEAMYDSNGNRTWSCDLDSFGRVRKFTGRLADCPFRYQGQYEDEETGLYYNRFRYYSPEMGGYISLDPIRLRGGFNLYAYVQDSNYWIDYFGLAGDGGAYIFTMNDGSVYVGKGSETRMNESILEHTKATATRPERTVIGKAHIDTMGNNELGKAVEYKVMVNEGAVGKTKQSKATIPQHLDNKIVTGKTAYGNLSEADVKLADELAVKLKQDMENDIKNNLISCSS